MGSAVRRNPPQRRKNGGLLRANPPYTLLALPRVARRRPYIGEMPEQIDLVLLAGAEPPRHGLRGDVFAIDAMDDAVDLEGREHQVDGRGRRPDGVAPAAKIAGDAPAD